MCNEIYSKWGDIRKMKEEHLFVVEKSIFANSHELFFWIGMALDFILGIFVSPIIAALGLEEGNVLNALFGSVFPQEFWYFLDGPGATYLNLACALISAIVAVFIIINIKTYKAYFYKDHIVVKGGFIARWERQMPLTPIVAVHMDQSFFGRIFDYASFTVEKVGHDEGTLLSDGQIGDLNGPDSILFRVSEASAVKECLEEMIVRTKGEISSIVGNHESGFSRENRPTSFKPVL